MAGFENSPLSACYKSHGFWVGEQGPEKIRTGGTNGVVTNTSKSKLDAGGQTVNFHQGAISLHVVLPPGSNPNAFPARNRRMIAEAAAQGLSDALEQKYGRG